MKPELSPWLFATQRGIFLSTPLFLLLQLIALALMYWRVIWRWSPDRVDMGRTRRWFLIGGVVISPIVMLIASAAFTTAYQEQYGHWFFSIHDNLAGLATVPFFVAGSAIAWLGFIRREFALTSGMHYVALWTLAAICAWHAFATLYLHLLTDGSMNGLQILAFVPAIAAANYAFRAVDVHRHGRVGKTSTAALRIWFSALAATIVVKCLLGYRFYSSLPVESPSGYGDCFVVSAAAKGHPRLVRSVYDAALDRRINPQWHTLCAFEIRLVQRHPAFHRGLRRLYNRIGPVVAARIRSPFAADLAYVLLKPLEWFATIYLRWR